MKVMYVIDTNPSNGGAPISTCMIAEEIAQGCNDVVVVMPRNCTRLSSMKAKKLEIVRFNENFPSILSSPSQALVLAKELKELIQRERPDIVHANMPRGAWALGLLRLARAFPADVRLVYTDREHVSQSHWMVRWLCNFLIASRYDAIVCVSRDSAKYWGRKVREAKVSVIPNAAGKLYERHEPSLHDEVRQQLMISRHHLSIMFAGRMIAAKNWGLAQEIITMLAGEDFHFIIVIAASTKDQMDQARIFIESIERLGVNYTYRQNLSQTEMSRLYYAADLFVLTSSRESFGRTAVEAMSRRCVVLGRNVGGLPEVICKSGNILECNAVQFADRIRHYQTNREELEIDKDWFYHRFWKEYTSDICRKRHDTLYRSLCDILELMAK